MSRDAFSGKEQRGYVDFANFLRSRSEVAGLWRSVFIGTGGGIARIRPYQPGDRIRRIHRPSLARGEVQVKDFFGERRLSVWLFFDITLSLASYRNLASITAHVAREALLLFSQLLCAGADVGRIPIGAAYLAHSQMEHIQPTQGVTCLEELVRAKEKISVGASMDLDRRMRLLRSSVQSAQRASMFFVSDFAGESAAYEDLLRDCRQLYKIDVTPVFVDTSWVLERFGKGRWELTGIDVLENKTGSLALDKESLPRIEEILGERKTELGSVFSRLNMPWVHLQEPDPDTYIQEATRCFRAKQGAAAA